MADEVVDTAEVPTAGEAEGGAEGGAEGEAVVTPKGSKKGKKKKAFDPLSDDDVKFKKIDFENALTPEEKAAKKAEKLAAKKGPKKGGKKKAPPPETQAVEEPEALPQAEEENLEKKAKQGKALTEAAPPPPPPKKEKPIEKEEPEPAKGKKGKSKKNKEEGAEKPKKEKKEKEGKKPKTKGKQEDETQASKAEPGDDKERGSKAEGDMQGLTEGTQTEDHIKLPEEGEPPSPKGKKGGKGKNKGKKGKKGAKGPSFSEFLENRASQQIEPDQWTWESYSVSEDVPVEPEPKGKKGKKGKGKKGKKGKKGASESGDDGGEKAEKPKKEKKGKKGKKGKKEEKPPEEPQPPAELDIFAEINRMKALAEAQAMGEVAEEVDEAPKKKKAKKAKKEKGEPKEKKPKGPKLTKEQKKKLAAEMAKIAEKEAIIAAKKAAEEERIRLIEERKANIEKEKREIREQQLRIEQLANSSAAMINLKERCVQRRIEERNDREWEQYLKCDGLPDPNVCGEMNTYLHLWEKNMEDTTMEEATEKTNEALYLVNTLTNLIDDSEFVDPEVLSNWKWLENMFGEYQQKSLDAATYKLLRDIERNLNRLDLFTADYKVTEKDFTVSFWLLISMPPSLPNPKRLESPRVYLDFPEVGMNVLFPSNIDCKFMAIRAMYLKYDHLSRETATFQDPSEPELYSENLGQVTSVEWRKKLFYKYEERRKYQKTIPLAELPAEDRLQQLELDNIEEDIPSVPYQKLEPTASEFVISEEDQIFLNLREAMIVEVEEHVINLRRFTVLGGVYFLNLYYQPPQPKDMVTFVMTVTRLEIPPHLSKVPFHKKIESLPPKEIGEEEEEEEQEEATQEEIDEFREEELNRLILIKFKIPTHVLLFQPPILCQWHRIPKVWSTVDIHEFEYDEEEKIITFKSGKFGSFAIATPRYLNFPFKYWEITANEDATITFALVTQILTVTFNVKENLVCISELTFQLEDFETDIIDPLIGQYHKVSLLIRILRDIGIEIFPPYDAFSYIEGTCEKYLIIEKFLYKIMGYLSICYNFVWSRWNYTAGRRNMIMLMREFKPGKPRQSPFSTLMVTPLRANFITCTEENEEFDDTAEDPTFYSDLYHLMRAISNMHIRSKIQNADPSTAVTLSELLLATRMLSLC